MSNKDWIKLPQFRKNKQNRKIHEAICLKCGHHFNSHRHITRHVQNCNGTFNVQNQFILKSFLPKSNSDIQILSFHKDLIEMFATSNISINQINNQNFTKIFTNLGIKESEIPKSDQFRTLIIQYSSKLFDENLKLFKNKPISLILDGTTSWNRVFYQFSLYFPGIVRHYSLINLDPATSKNIKEIINKICEELLQNQIYVVGVTTDNASNLISCFNQIQKDSIEKKINFPIIHFSCAAHTSQLLINDLKKSSSVFSQIVNKSIKFIRWTKKKRYLNQFKNVGLNDLPPNYQETRWNSLYICILYILNHFEFFKNTIPQISIDKKPCPFEFTDDNIRILTEIQKVLKPILEFTNKVQKTFYSVGEVFLDLLQLQKEIFQISKPDDFGFVNIIQKNLTKRFDENCDFILCELGYLLTNEGRM